MIDFSSQEKTSFLFIGTLNKRKGLEDLIIAFSDLIKKNKINDIHLNIIGDGKEKDNLIELAKLHSIESRVNFLGQITSSKEKEVYFKKAIASISPKQAGLSVLESFSYGVPFLAYKDAISGGEHLNIKSGTNGYLLNDKEELTSTMKEILENTTLSKQLGKDRKSTRLNSSHVRISYAVFCLKKKKKKQKKNSEKKKTKKERKTYTENGGKR